MVQPVHPIEFRMISQNDNSSRRGKVAIITGHYVEETELFRVIRQLRASQIDYEVLTPPSLVNPSGTLTSMHWDATLRQGNEIELGENFRVSRSLSDMILSYEYAALALPGGILSVTLLRESPEYIIFIQDFSTTERPILWMGFAPLLALSANILPGKTLTSNPTIRSEITAAGAHWLDQGMVQGENWISTRDIDALTLGVPRFVELLELPEVIRSQTVRSQIAKARLS